MECFGCFTVFEYKNLGSSAIEKGGKCYDTERSKEHFFLEQSIEKIQQMLQTEQISYDLYFEIVTNNYGKPELERHHNYEIILNREVLYIY